MNRVLISESSNIYQARERLEKLAQKEGMDQIEIGAVLDALDTIFESICNLSGSGQHANFEKQVGKIKIVGKLRKDFSLLEKMFH